MTSQKLIRLLRSDGWYETAQNGSHKQFKHDKKKGKLTVPVHAGRDIPIGTLNAILKQAGLK